MDNKELELLLHRPESATLEFKRQFYDIGAADGVVKKRQKHELVKDILALANGNANVAGETAHLVIGAEDNLDEDGNRTCYDIGDLEVKSQQLLNIINAYCEPPMQDLWCEIVGTEGTRLLVITIPPSPYLYETTQKLETPKQTYSPYVVFVRRDENVDLASAREREAIAQLKRLRYQEAQNAPPVQFGAALGALLIGSAVGHQLVQTTGRKEIRAIGWIAGGLLGAIAGGMLGSTYKNVRSLSRDVSSMPKHIQPWAITGGVLAGGSFIGIGSWATRRFQHWLARKQAESSGDQGKEIIQPPQQVTGDRK